MILFKLDFFWLGIFPFLNSFLLINICSLTTIIFYLVALYTENVRPLIMDFLNFTFS